MEGVSQTVKLACFQAIGDAGLAVEGAVEGFGTLDHRLRIVLDPHPGVGGVRAEASQQVELAGIMKLERDQVVEGRLLGPYGHSSR